MDYSGNSNKSKRKLNETAEEPKNKKKITKMVEGPVKREKKGELQRAVEAFLPEEGVQGIKNHILMDVVVPTIKKIISDTVDTILYGTIGGSNTSRTSINGRSSYQKYYDQRDANKYSNPNPVLKRSAGGYDFENVILETKGEAMSIIAYMQDTIDEYESVSVADFYEMVDVTGSYTDYNYGWMDLDSVPIVQLKKGGWLIKLPRPMKLPATIVG